MKPSARMLVILLPLVAALPAAAQTPKAPPPAAVVEPARSPRAPRAIGRGDLDVVHVRDAWDVRTLPPTAFEAQAPIEPMHPDVIHLSRADAIMAHELPTPLPPMTPMAPTAPAAYYADASSRIAGFATSPRVSWAPRDTADSLYRVAREALNRQEYRGCARIFHDLREKYPRSQYVPHASYWEAFCLYRVGTTEDLRAAQQVLRTAQNERWENSMQADAVALSARILSALARRGDAEAIEAVRRSAQQQGATCDREEMLVKVEVLSALAQTDEALAQSTLRRVLANRDKCTVELRKRAVYLLVRKPDSTALPALLEVVRNDPEEEVRSYAVQYMSRVPGRATDQALQEILRTSDDERVQVAAVRAIAGREDWSGLRALIERSDVRTELRAAALQRISRERSSAEDAAWVRGLYPRVGDVTLKRYVVDAVGRLGGDENERWLVGIASNAAEPTSVRQTAISRLSRSKVPVEQFIRIYDASSERGMREQLVRLLGERAKEDESAIDKLISIVRTGTDPEVRRSAVNVLARHRQNEKVARLFEELIGR
jgi:HEAT repeat protein